MAASAQAQLKSILKKTQSSLSNSTSSIPRSQTPTNVTQSTPSAQRLATAISQARLIQDQKTTLLTNLNSIEELSDYPSSSPPTEEEVSRFLTLVLPFQPSDYDALLEERHINYRCGWTLCANPPRKADAKRPWLRPKGAGNWCSEDCARRALYIKAQLDETPAWERRGGGAGRIVLFDEERLAEGKKVVSEEEERRAKARQLALERGEGRVAAFRVEEGALTEIVEKVTTGADVVAPSLGGGEEDDGVGHAVIEGYTTKGVGGYKHKGVHFDDDENDDSYS